MEAAEESDVPAAMPTSLTVAVYAAPDRLTAEMVRGALEDAGIPAVIGEQVADAYAGAFALAEGYWGEIRVPAGEAERAHALLDALESGQGAATDAELSAGADAVPDRSL